MTWRDRLKRLRKLIRPHALAAERSFLIHWSSLALLKIRKRGQPVVCIGLIEHLGDIVAAEPLAREIRRLHPAAYIVWCVREPFREVVEAFDIVDRVLSLPCLTEWILLDASRIFDTVYDLHVQGRRCPTCDIRLRRRKGNPLITEHNYFDFGNLLQVMCQYVDIQLGDVTPRLRLPANVSTAVERLDLPDRYIVFHCNSNEASRDWPRENWQRLAETLARDSCPPMIEIGLSPVISKPRPIDRDLCGKLTILQSAEVIRRCTLFIGIDSGPAHLANAVEARGILLMSSYRAFKRYMPYSGRFADGRSAIVLHVEGGLSSLSVDAVAESIRRSLEAPVHAEGRSPLSEQQ